MKALSRAFATAALAALSVGCTVEETEQLPDTIAPEFGDDVGQDPAGAPSDTPAYPGPYGLALGSVIPNFALYGFTDYSQSNAPTEIDLSHFYNPTGTEVFPEGSRYGAGSPKPKAIVLMMSAVWCGPCQYEASVLLPAHIPEYTPDVKFVATLIDGPTPGTAATLKDVENWASKYDVFYPLANDPGETIMSLYEPAFPGNMIIRTSDMRIMYRIAGAVDPASSGGAQFWNTLDQVVAGTYQPPGN